MRGEYIKALSDSDHNGETVTLEDYRYAELRYRMPLEEEVYLKAQYGGNGYRDGPDSVMVGAKIGAEMSTTFGGGIFYNRIMDNFFEVIMASPMYTEWQ